MNIESVESSTGIVLGFYVYSGTATCFCCACVVCVCGAQWHSSGTCCVVVLLWEAQLALTRWKPPARGREELWREEREEREETEETEDL